MATWNLDPNHSSAVFEVRHMMVTWLSGRFKLKSGMLEFDPAEVAKASVEVEIDAGSIFTGHEARDEDLRSANYLDVVKFPLITFKSSIAEPAGLDQCLLKGELFIHGVTRPVVLDVRYAGPSHFHDEARRLTTFGFRATTLINREDFGIVTNVPIDDGGFMVGKHVLLTLYTEADLVE